MQRFRSPLITLARLRRQQQRLSELDLARRLNAQSQIVDQLDGLRRTLETELQSAAISSQTGFTAAQLLALQARRDRHLKAIQQLEARRRDAEAEVLDATESLRQIVAARATVDRILAEQKREHRRDQRRTEQIALDEQTARRWQLPRGASGGEVTHG